MPGTIAVLPLQADLPVRDIGGYLALLLGRWRSVDAARAAGERREPDYGAPARRAPSAITSRCSCWLTIPIRPTRGRRSASGRPIARSCSRVTSAPARAAAAASAWLRAGDARPRRHRTGSVGRPRSSPATCTWCAAQSTQGPAVEALARRLAGRSIGLVLSGGGARAFAHVGVLEELLARRADRSTAWRGAAAARSSAALFAWAGRPSRSCVAATPSSWSGARWTTTRCRSLP